MQNAPNLQLNRRHPDFRGLKICLPFDRKDINAQVDLVSRDKYTIGAGTLTLANMAGGPGLKNASGVLANLVGTRATAIWTNNASVSCQVLFTSLANSPGLWDLGGFGMCSEAGGEPRLWNAASTSCFPGGTGQMVINKWYTLGARYNANTPTADLYINGVKYHCGTNVVFTALAQATKVGTCPEPSRTIFDGFLRDFRMWDRFMPDETFERAHWNPNAFYVNRRIFLPRVITAVPFNASRFMPFMHPSLQS